ncbi:hypothetical protein JP36_10370 [Gallibacterium genomosp. 1]|uniref:Uncharacterized protein n=2 Tax=Gallibacterium genomosp. 1 TaxID=155515 RepID=A0A0A2XVC3_9PAST|nr:hypothetical protein JP36_10370 [Gallibacterium genomosp. 1]
MELNYTLLTYVWQKTAIIFRISNNKFDNVDKGSHRYIAVARAIEIYLRKKDIMVGAAYGFEW